MTTKKLIATTAMAALAVPAAAVADKPEQHGSQGKTKSAQKKAAKSKRGQFTLSATKLSGLTVTDGKLTGALTADPTAANKFARTFLQLTKADIRGDKTVTFGTAGDAVVVRFNGLTADQIQPTDRAKVIGKVRNGELDIRKIVVSRPDADDSDSDSDKS